MAIQVVIVEDDVDLRDTFCRYLTRVGMNVTGVGSVEEFEALNVSPDIAIFDINLPGDSGLVGAGRLRLTSRAGIIMLTARDALDDKVLGLSLGADAYLVKPVHIRELEAMIRSLYRRLTDENTSQPQAPVPVEDGAWILDTRRWSLTPPGRQNGVPLSAAEYHFLSVLMRSFGQPVPREDILQALGKGNSETELRGLDTLLSRLRKKVETEVAGIEFPVRSVRGIGYVFAAPARNQ